MSLIGHGNELVLALNKKIVFISISENRVTKHAELSSDITPCEKSQPIGSEACQNEQIRKNDEPLRKIKQIELSPNGDYLAVSTAGRKMLLLYKINADSLELLSVRRISRASSGLAIANDSSKILVCDKTGDCYLFDCIKFETPGKWILGHPSMVLDVLFTPSQSAIVTSDRDEKIRVTNFPATHEIECYCLGHTEYVSSIEFIPSDLTEYLVSLSGDKKLKVWKYQVGRQIHEISLQAPGIKFVIRQLDKCEIHLAVLVYQPDESIFIYRLQYFDDNFKSSLVSSHSFPGKIITDLCFCNDALYLTISTDGRLGLESLRFENEVYCNYDTKRLNELLHPVYQHEEITELEDVSSWFKKKFDNLTEYLERKKRRIDGKRQSKGT